MKHLVCLLCIVFLPIDLLAADNPCVAPLFSTNDPSFLTFDNNSSTNSGIPAPPYGGYIGPDTWLSFVMPTNGFYLLLNGITMIDPAIAIYSGPCTEPKLLYNVLDNNCNGDTNPFLFIDNLTPGVKYYIRVWAQNGSTNGVFEIKLVETLSVIPDFLAFADASIVGDCIELTQNQNNQQGCAWFQNAIDFNAPLIHEMTANFGTNNASGADGICLVYQSNGQDFCGGSGEGIGAGGMPNSAIFEFDTWQNGNLNDLSDDHCAFNVNGDMNHNNSIEGPVALGNIEDGLDHTILFEWNPVGNLYFLYFDNALVLSGSYDIINNCFGGSNMAFWGYTSSTGGSSNTHVICPGVNIYEPSFMEYNEVNICEGETHLGHSESGFFVDFVPGADGCSYQINTLLTVHEIPEPVYITEIVCEGEYILVADNAYTLPNSYIINSTTLYGCDSLIYLELENIVTEIEIDVSSLITCIDSVVVLIPISTSNFIITDIDYTWTYYTNTYSQEALNVTEPGTYLLSSQVTTNGIECTVEASVAVVIDTISPPLQDLVDVYLDCSNIGTDTVLIVNGLGDDVEAIWIFEDSIISDQMQVNIVEAGTYTFIATDSSNGCQSIDSLEVLISNEVPIIELSADIYNCQNQSFDLNFSANGSIDSFVWMHENQFFSNDSLPEFTEAGNYSISVINGQGCESLASVNLQVDTLRPVVELQDLTVPCDSLSGSISLVSDFDLEWSGPNIMSESGNEITIIEEGWYYLMVVNPENYCESTDSSYVQFLGSSPLLSLDSDLISCFLPEVNINLSANQIDLSYSWTNQFDLISDDKDLNVNTEGWYYVSVSNENGCSAEDSIFISSNLTVPFVNVEFDTIDCLQNSAFINAEIFEGGTTSWLGPNMFVSSSDSLIATDPGVYYLSVINSESGCEANDAISIVDISIVPEFTIGPDTLDCTTGNLALPFSIVTSYNTIAWVGPNGFSSDEEIPEVFEQGEYLVHIEFDGNCSLDTSLSISEDVAQPMYTVDFDSITCHDPYVSFQFDLESVDDNLLLTSPSGIINSLLDFQSEEGGEYYFSLIGDNGCETKDTFFVSQYLIQPQVSVEDIDTITCYTPIINIVALSDDNDLIYNWFVDNLLLWDAKEITVEQGGEYSLMVTNQYGCTNEVDVFVNAFLKSPEIIMEGEDLTCDHQEASLGYFTEDDNLEVFWNGDYNFTNLVNSITVTSEGWYSLEATNEYGCAAKDSFYVKSYSDAPYIELLTADTVVVDADNPNGQLLIDADIEVEISWFPESGLSCTHCFDPIISSTDINAYEVTITNAYGCTASEVIHVRYQRELKVYIPNVFSPSNGDGMNDFFTLYGNENIASINSMQIFDRWGSLVGQKKNFAPNDPKSGWDGTTSGQHAVSGVYTYVFLITDTEGTVTSYYGDVTLL